jgi:GINS complex subunit 2
MGEMLLEAASDDLVEPESIRRLMRDLREVRMAKMRKGVEILSGEGEGVRLDGVGAMEVGESRGFITGVINGLRKIGASKEQARKEREAEERENGYAARGDEDDDMAYDPS